MLRTKKHQKHGKKTMNKRNSRNKKTLRQRKRGGDFFPNVKYSPLVKSPNAPPLSKASELKSKFLPRSLMSSMPSSASSSYSCYYKNNIFNDFSKVNSEDPWELQDIYVKCCSVGRPQKGLFSSKKTVKGTTNPFCTNLSKQYTALASALNEKTKKEEYDVSNFGDKSIQTPTEDEIVNRPAIISKNA